MLWPHLTFYTHEAMQRLEDETLARCFEALRGQPLQVASRDPRLRAQTPGRALRRRRLSQAAWIAVCLLRCLLFVDNPQSAA